MLTHDARISAQMPPVALLYRRVSREEQKDKGRSLDVQAKTCRQYAHSHAWPIEDEYEDVLTLLWRLHGGGG